MIDRLMIELGRKLGLQLGGVSYIMWRDHMSKDMREWENKVGHGDAPALKMSIMHFALSNFDEVSQDFN